MNYQNIYNLLIKKAQNRMEITGYTEKHHIIPRSLGGNDDPSNIVVFTGREHFIAHLLLAKIHGGKMVHAAYMMSTRKGYTNRLYENLRIKFSEKISKDKVRASKISQSLKGKVKSKSHREAYKQSRIQGGGWVCPEHKREHQRIAMKGSGNPMYGKTHNDLARLKISEANKQKTSCPHCNKIGGIAIMKRWHFDNCKVLTQK